VESHVRAARRKLGARSRATAVHVATRNGSDGELAAPPLVIVADGARAAAVADELRTAGWRTLDGWDIPATEWRVEQHRLVCHGPVRDADEAEAALRAAVRGAGLVAALDDREPFAAAFFESLRRLGTVQLRDGAPVLGPDLRRVLALVAGGASVAEVAALTHQSPRTVKRRLAAARAALGARTTAEAIRLLGAR
jgi:DNA-binding NarL/FixJ family response regulator